MRARYFSPFEMETIAQRIAGTHADTNKGWGTTAMSLQQFGIADANASAAVMFLMARSTARWPSALRLSWWEAPPSWRAGFQRGGRCVSIL